MSLTKDDLQAITKIVDAVVQPIVEDLKWQTAAGFAEVHDMFEEVNGKFTEVNGKFVETQGQIAKLQEKVAEVHNEVKAVDYKVDQSFDVLKRVEAKLDRTTRKTSENASFITKLKATVQDV